MTLRPFRAVHTASKPPPVLSLRPLGRAALFLGFLLPAACIFGPDREAGLEVRRFAPLPVYEIWWAEMEECTGIEGDLGRVRFYEVLAPLNEERTAFPCDERGTMCPAFWRRPHDIFLAPAVIENELFVKHEMWHDLRQMAAHRNVDDCPGVFASR